MRFFVCAACWLGLLIDCATITAQWRVGLSSTIITPDEPTWLCGYSSRTRPADGKVHDLYAKAVALEDARGERLVLLTLDLGSVSSYITDRVAGLVHQRLGLPRGNLILNCSHTHCAPEVAAERRVFHDLPDDEERKLVRYIEQLIDKLATLVASAVGDLSPGRLWLSQSRAGFAFNRRNPQGIDSTGVTEREVPVLAIRTPDGRLRGVLFGYACHNTTLAFQQYSGDYAGFAQQALEARFPGTTALFVMGCGGDQNPQPRHGAMGLEYARRHGRDLADAVVRGLDTGGQEVSARLSVAFGVAELPLEPLPETSQLLADTQTGSGHAQRKAAYLLDRLQSGQAVDTVQPCPLHVARLGDKLLMIFFSGETVVDYSLRAKRDFGPSFVWSAGYCNDVFAYLPSRRVLLEGGYEGRTGIVHQLTPTPFLPEVESRVMDTVARLVGQVQANPSGNPESR